MQLHQIKSSKKRPKKRIGRGGKKGTYCGKGMKGQKSRAGAKIRPELRDFIKKIPKTRGYKG
jgi:large subunit ribosomal protein L15